MSLPTFPGIFAVSHNPVPPAIQVVGVGVGTVIASTVAAVETNPLLQTLVIGMANTIVAIVVGAVIKHLSGHGRAKREERAKHTRTKIESLISQHEADVRTITELQDKLDQARAENERIRGDQR